MTGVVAQFDADRGHGTIQADDGRGYFFHCTAIADGSRHVDEGARVTFEVVAGHQGRWEAADVRPDS